MTLPETQPTPVARDATVRGVPQNRGIIQPPDKDRLRAALTGREGAEAELRAAGLAAVENKSSVRELAAFTGLSTNTISRWKREGR